MISSTLRVLASRPELWLLALLAACPHGLFAGPLITHSLGTTTGPGGSPAAASPLVPFRLSQGTVVEEPAAAAASAITAPVTAASGASGVGVDDSRSSQEPNGATDAAPTAGSSAPAGVTVPDSEPAVPHATATANHVGSVGNAVAATAALPGTVASHGDAGQPSSRVAIANPGMTTATQPNQPQVQNIQAPAQGKTVADPSTSGASLSPGTSVSVLSQTPTSIVPSASAALAAVSTGQTAQASQTGQATSTVAAVVPGATSSTVVGGQPAPASGTQVVAASPVPITTAVPAAPAVPAAATQPAGAVAAATVSQAAVPTGVAAASGGTQSLPQSQSQGGQDPNVASTVSGAASSAPGGTAVNGVSTSLAAQLLVALSPSVNAALNPQAGPVAAASNPVTATGVQSALGTNPGPTSTSSSGDNATAPATATATASLALPLPPVVAAPSLVSPPPDAAASGLALGILPQNVPEPCLTHLLVLVVGGLAARRAHSRGPGWIRSVWPRTISTGQRHGDLGGQPGVGDE